MPIAACMDALLLAGKPEEAFNCSERARVAYLLDVLAARCNCPGSRAGLFEEERRLNEQIAGLKAAVSQ